MLLTLFFVPVLYLSQVLTGLSLYFIPVQNISVVSESQFVCLVFMVAHTSLTMSWLFAVYDTVEQLFLALRESQFLLSYCLWVQI